MNRLLADVDNEFAADIIISRLAESGIHAWIQSNEALQSRGGPTIRSRCTVYVEESELERARAALAEAEAVDEDELARLAEEAGPPPRI